MVQGGATYHTLQSPGLPVHNGTASPANHDLRYTLIHIFLSRLCLTKCEDTLALTESFKALLNGIA